MIQHRLKWTAIQPPVYSPFCYCRVRHISLGYILANQRVRMNRPISKGVSSAFARVFSGRSAILKIVEELALRTRLSLKSDFSKLRDIPIQHWEYSIHLYRVLISRSSMNRPFWRHRQTDPQPTNSRLGLSFDDKEWFAPVDEGATSLKISLPGINVVGFICTRVIHDLWCPCLHRSQLKLR